MKLANYRRRIFPFYYGWVIVGAAFIERVFAMGLYNNMGVFFKPVMGDFGWTRAQTAGAFSVARLTIGGLSPFVGALADKYGPRLLIAAEAVSLATGYLLVSRMTSLWQFYLFFVLFIGLGQSAGSGSILPTLPRWFEAKRGTVQGIVQSGAGLGIGLLPIPLTYLILTQGWRFTFAISGVAIGVMVLLVAWVYRSSPQAMGLLPDGRTGEDEATEMRDGIASRSAKNPHALAGGMTLRQALATQNLRKLLFASAAASFAHAIIATHLVPHATDVGFSPGVAAIFMSVIGLANMLGKIVVGITSDRVGRRVALIFCFSLAASMFVLLMSARGFWAFFIFSAGFGFAYGGWLPLFPTISADLFGVGSLGAIYGLTHTSGAMGGASADILGGYIFDVTKSYNYAFLLAEMLLLGGLGLLLSLHVPKK